MEKLGDRRHGAHLKLVISNASGDLIGRGLTQKVIGRDRALRLLRDCFHRGPVGLMKAARQSTDRRRAPIDALSEVRKPQTLEQKVLSEFHCPHNLHPVQIDFKRKFSLRALDRISRPANTGGMADQKHRRAFIREWRKHRNLTQEQLAERTGASNAKISRLERGITPYDQESLEALAAALNCTPADLLTRTPAEFDLASKLLDTLSVVPESRQARVIEALQLLALDDEAAEA